MCDSTAKQTSRARVISATSSGQTRRPRARRTRPVGKAVIHSLDLDGAVARQAGYPGLVVGTVDGADVTATQVAGAIAVGFLERPSVVVVLRRPVERRPTKGIARSANNENETFDWHPDVEVGGVELANNPMNAKRDHVVFEALEAKYAHRMADDKRMMPPEDKVKNLCKREWAKRKKEKGEEAQNAAAAAVAAMERGDGGGGGDDDDDDDASGDDDGDGDGAGDGASDGADGDTPLPRRATGTGEGSMDTSAEDTADDDGNDGDVVDSLNLGELRTKLKELGARVTVTNGDLEGKERRTATQAAILRVRLRAAFARL